MGAEMNCFNFYKFKNFLYNGELLFNKDTYRRQKFNIVTVILLVGVLTVHS